MEYRTSTAGVWTVTPDLRECANCFRAGILLIGNDATEQNPLVAWQIRPAIRHVGARLYVVDSRA